MIKDEAGEVEITQTELGLGRIGEDGVRIHVHVGINIQIAVYRDRAATVCRWPLALARGFGAGPSPSLELLSGHVGAVFRRGFEVHRSVGVGRAAFGRWPSVLTGAARPSHNASPASPSVLLARFAGCQYG